MFRRSRRALVKLLDVTHRPRNFVDLTIRREVRALTKKARSAGRRGFTLLIVAVVAFAAVTVALLAWISETGGGGDLEQGEVAELLAGIPQNGTSLGEPDAPVTIHIYEDFQCPACAMFARETFPGIVERHVEPGEARIVSETLAFLGPDSTTSARAALAAGKQDRYWHYALLLFLNQGPENSGYATDEFLTELANDTRGLDIGRWNEARSSGSGEADLEAARQRARQDGATSTPTLVVTGPGGERKLVGAVPMEEVEAAIEEVGGP